MKLYPFEDTNSSPFEDLLHSSDYPTFNVPILK